MIDVLIATSRDTPAEMVTPLAAALGARDLEVKTVDLGRMGQTGSRLGKVVQAIIGEVEAGRLLRELAASTPKVAVALDPGALAALVLARDRRVSATPVVAVIADLAPGKRWALNADRYAVIDDEAAVLLADHGVDGARVLVVGPIVPRSLHEAAHQPRAEIRREYKLPEAGHVALVDTRGLSLEGLAQLTLQLSLLAKPAHLLFDAAGSAEAAAQLRRQVPGLGIKGKLFGETPNAPRLWRAADVVLARPTPRALHGARSLGALFVALEPDGERQASDARALVERGLGVVAEKLIFAAGALDSLLGRRPPAAAAADGAAEIADLIAEVAAHKDEVLAETFADTAAAEPDEPADAGELEDLGSFDLGGDDERPSPPPRRDPGEDRLQREIAEARAEAERWEQRRALAEARGDRTLAADAAREADRKRARMHAALEDLRRLQRAAGTTPPPEDPLIALKRKVRDQPGEPAPKSLDDELTDLKRRMRDKPGGRGR